MNRDEGNMGNRIGGLFPGQQATGALGGGAGQFPGTSPWPPFSPTGSTMGSEGSSMKRAFNSPKPLGLVDPDRLLLFLIVDYFKRRGMAASVTQILTEARIDPMSSETIEAVHLMESLNQMHGRNPQAIPMMPTDPGFLREWWGTFWQLYQSRLSSLASNNSIPKSPIPTNIINPNNNNNNNNPSNNAVNNNNSQAMQNQMNRSTMSQNRRILIMNAMQAVGLAGRDPSTLNPEEQRKVAIAIQHFQAQQLQRMQFSTPAIKNIQKSPTLSPIAPNIIDPSSLQKRKQPETLSSASAIHSSNFAYQQAIQAKAMQNSMMAMMQTPMATSNGNRIILPGGMPTHSMQSTQPLQQSSTQATTTTRPIKPLKPMQQQGVGADFSTFFNHSNSISPSTATNNSNNSHQFPTELDESGLMAFFDSQSHQDWFGFTADNNTGTSTSVLQNDEHGNIPSGTLYHTQSKQVVGGGLSLESLAVQIMDTLPSPQELVLESPQPEQPLTDPNDLLLVSHEDQAKAPSALKTTESGFYLKAIAALGHHKIDSKASSASFSHDGLLLASGGHDKQVLIFSTTAFNMELLYTLEGHHEEKVTQVRFAPSGGRRLLATASFDKTIHLWDLGNEGSNINDPINDIPTKPYLILKDTHEEPVWSIDFVPYMDKTTGVLSMRLCSIDAVGKLVLWDLDSGAILYSTLMQTLSDGRAVTVRQIKCRPTRVENGESVIIAIADGSNVVLFDCTKMEFIGVVPVILPMTTANFDSSKGSKMSIVGLNWGDQSSPNNLITASIEAVSVWDLTNLLEDPSQAPRLIATHGVLADKITCCSLLYDPDTNASLALFGGYQSIYIWEFADGSATIEHRSRVQKFPAHEGLVVALPVTKSGPLMISSASHDGWIRLWELGRTATA